MAVLNRVDNMSTYTNASFIAHRGLQSQYPENSIIGIEAAIKAGAIHVEVDVQFSRDGIALLYHDYDLQRISATQGSVADFDAAQLQQLSAYEPQRFGAQFQSLRLPLLQDLIAVIEAHPDVHFFIELKGDAIADHGYVYCVQHLRQLFKALLAQITLISFDAMAVKYAKTEGLFPRIGVVLRDWETRDAVIADTQADIAYINLKRIPKAEKIQATCPIAVYEIADVALALQTLQRGASKIETFAIDILLQELCLKS